MGEILSNIITSEITFYLVVAYNIGLLVYLGIDILQD